MLHWVFARDEDFNSPTVHRKQIEELYRYEDRATLDVTVTARSGAQSTIRTTPEHPFAIDGAGWVPAGDLTVGMKTIDMDGKLGTITALTDAPGLHTVHNFSVTDDHTYFVSDLAVWVHNQSYGAAQTQPAPANPAGAANGPSKPQLRIIQGGKLEQKPSGFSLRKLFGLGLRTNTLLAPLALSGDTVSVQNRSFTLEGFEGEFHIQHTRGETVLEITQILEDQINILDADLISETSSIQGKGVKVEEFARGYLIDPQSSFAQEAGNLLLFTGYSGSENDTLITKVNGLSEANFLSEVIERGANIATVQQTFNALSAANTSFNPENRDHRALALAELSRFREEDTGGSNQIRVQVQGKKLAKFSGATKTKKNGYEFSNLSVSSTSIPKLVAHGQLLEAQSNIASRDSKILEPAFADAHKFVSRSVGAFYPLGYNEPHIVRGIKGSDMRVDVQFFNRTNPQQPNIGP